MKQKKNIWLCESVSWLNNCSERFSLICEQIIQTGFYEPVQLIQSDQMQKNDLFSNQTSPLNFAKFKKRSLHPVKRHKMQLFIWRSVSKSLLLDTVSNKYLWANNEEIRGCSARSVSVPGFGIWNTAWNPWAEPLAPFRLSGPEQIHSTTVMP